MSMSTTGSPSRVFSSPAQRSVPSASSSYRAGRSNAGSAFTFS